MKIKWRKTRRGHCIGRTMEHLPNYVIYRYSDNAWQLTGPFNLYGCFDTQRDCRRMAQAHCDIVLGE